MLAKRRQSHLRKKVDRNARRNYGEAMPLALEMTIFFLLVEI